MAKRNAPSKAPSAHPGSTNLMKVLEKVAPFLFKKSGKRKTENAARISKSVIREPLSVVRKKASNHPAKKKSAKISKKSKTKPVRLPAATLEARKTVKAPVTVSAPVETLDTPAPIADKKPKGRFILAPDEPKIDAKAVTAELLADAKDDAFLGKVALKQADGKEVKKVSAWSLLGSRFFGGKDEASAKHKDAAPAMKQSEIAQDSFLQRVQKKNPNAVVGTAVDPDEIEAAKLTGKKTDAIPESLDDLAHGDSTERAPVAERQKGRILSAADLRKETKEAKEAALRLEKEVKEIKEEMRARGKDVKEEKQSIEPKKPAPAAEKPVETPQPLKAKQLQKPKSGFQKFIAGVGYIGLGKERMAFVQNLATMLNAGLPLIDAIRTIQAETKPKPMKKLLQRILDAVDNGSPLWRAMEAQSFFTPHAIALVRIGEEAGSLSENMTYLAAQEEKDHELKSKVKMAMIYPSIVMTIMVVVVVILGMFVLPNLIGVLTSLNVPLPLVTRIVIAVSNMFTEYGTIGVPAGLGGLVVLMVLNKYTPLKVVFQWITFRIPGVGALAREATIARFGVILGGLMKAGVPVTEAMHSMVEVTTIVAYRNLYSRMLDHITIGDSFSKTFETLKESKKLIPPSVQQLVVTGEKSGALADIMLKIADIYDKKASETAQKLPIILEPMLLLFMGGLVGTIAFAILVPIYSIVGNVGR